MHQQIDGLMTDPMLFRAWLAALPDEREANPLNCMDCFIAQYLNDHLEDERVLCYFRTIDRMGGDECTLTRQPKWAYKFQKHFAWVYGDIPPTVALAALDEVLQAMAARDAADDDDDDNYGRLYADPDYETTEEDDDEPLPSLWMIDWLEEQQ